MILSPLTTDWFSWWQWVPYPLCLLALEYALCSLYLELVAVAVIAVVAVHSVVEGMETASPLVVVHGLKASLSPHCPMHHS